MMLDTGTASSEQRPVDEEVDAVVVNEARPLPVRRSPAELVATQAAVVGGSFVAGAVVCAVVARRRSGKAARRRKRSGQGSIAASRSFLVDVHMLQR
ncbi:unannotated protein [freshwater metagenome]|uniref:Unannotated protein n=1 Tax=freshwater metagenome TaxID=449393 RepID=A0A6J5ZV17_9ZZZZ|nr:hypothetical protein [Actinomycetota bacterium]